MTTLKTSAKVNFESQERLDLPDLNTIMDNPRDALVETQGALGGARILGSTAAVGVSGSLSQITFNTATLASTVIEGPLSLINYLEVQPGQHEGQVVLYDPSATGQQTTIDLTPFSGGALTPYIWARRVDLPTNADTRRKWDTGSGSEIVFSLATEIGYRVEFEPSLSDKRTASEPEWFVIAKVESWAGLVPTIRTWSPLDCGRDPSTLPNVTWSTNPLSNAPLGYNQAFSLLASMLVSLQDTTFGTHFLNTTFTRGIKQINSQIDTNATDIAALTAAGKIKGIGHLMADGAGGWLVYDNNNFVSAAVVAGSGGWQVDVTFTVAGTYTAQMGDVGTPTGMVSSLVWLEQAAGVPSATTRAYMSTVGFASTNPPNVAPSGSPPGTMSLVVLCIG